MGKGMRNRQRETSCMASDDSVVAASLGMGEPCSCVRARLRSEQSAVVGWQSWQQDAVAKLKVACTRRVEQPRGQSPRPASSLGGAGRLAV